MTHLPVVLIFSHFFNLAICGGGGPSAHHAEVLCLLDEIDEVSRGGRHVFFLLGGGGCVFEGFGWGFEVLFPGF